MLVRSGALDVVAIDSVAALVPKAEIEGEMGDSLVGLQARLMSQALRKLTGTLSRTGTVCIFTNQLREKIGVMFGSPETTPGGRALKFYASVRLDIRRIETLKEGGEAIGNRVRVKVVKNKVAPPFRQSEFDIIYGEGISWEGSVLDVGLEKSIIQKSGSYFSFGEERLGQGRANAAAFLVEHPDTLAAILALIAEGEGLGLRGEELAAPAAPRCDRRRLRCAARPRCPAAGRHERRPGGRLHPGARADDGHGAPPRRRRTAGGGRHAGPRSRSTGGWLVLEEADVLRLGLHAGLALDDTLASRAVAAAREADATRRAGGCRPTGRGRGRSSSAGWSRRPARRPPAW